MAGRNLASKDRNGITSLSSIHSTCYWLQFWYVHIRVVRPILQSSPLWREEQLRPVVQDCCHEKNSQSYLAELRICNLVSAALVYSLLLFQISHRLCHSNQSEVDEQLGCEGVTISCWDWNFLGRNTFMVLPPLPTLLVLPCYNSLATSVSFVSTGPHHNSHI